MAQPIDITDTDVSPLSLSVSSPTSSFSDFSLDRTLVDVEASDGKLDDREVVSLTSSHSSDEDRAAYSFPSSPSSVDSCLLTSSDFDADDISSTDSCTDPACCPAPPRAVEKPYLIPETSFSPLIVVGAGPHSLALAARLSEPRPAALYTDLEHARLSWLQREQAQDGRRTKHKRQTVKGHWSQRKIIAPKTVTIARTAQEKNVQGIQVLDSTADHWLGRWKGFFAGLRIKHLRSPMLFHPAPADVDALVAYSRRMSAEHELEPIHGVVGKELSKHQKKKRTQKVNGSIPINERDRQDYYRPSTPLFGRFVKDDVIERYDLDSLVTHTTVKSISYGPLHVAGQEPCQGFLVSSLNPDGSTSVRASKAVVVAPGPSNRPNIPLVVQQALPPTTLPNESGSPWDPKEIRGRDWCHSSAFALPGFSPLKGPLGGKVRRGASTTVVVIGGGLTSVQIIDSLLAQGVTKVHLVCRSHIKIKHFDFPLEWVSKYNNLEKASFWNAPTYEDRLAIIQQARDGGSVNPQFYKILQNHIKAGRVELKTLSSITRATYHDDADDSQRGQSRWTIEGTTKPAPSRIEAGLGQPERWQLDEIDYLVSSTGSKISLDSLDFMQRIRTEHAIEEVGGLPCVTRDLQWNDELPLFLMGAYSMLELGPDALNLSGTRTGAERVAHRLGQLGIFETYRRQDANEATRHVDEEDTVRTRMQEKQYRSGGEGNFFLGLREVEA
ncbi:uncharacterized protein JCM15063_003467 [Sporobolomyces koalae]|uniref:uncharacterized protein n=1 Tax=Sporobolomyces koalae TaxID=500713 RepID=UPI00317ED4F7